MLTPHLRHLWRGGRAAAAEAQEEAGTDEAVAAGEAACGDVADSAQAAQLDLAQPGSQQLLPCRHVRLFRQHSANVLLGQ